jgi:peptide/nickel transport system substrate-binding protein
MFHTRRTLVAWSLLVSIALVLAACGGGATPTAAPVQPTAVTQPTVSSQPTAAVPSTVAPQSTEVPKSTEAPAKTEPVILKIGWTGKPDTLNPAYAFLSEAYSIFDLTYGTLVREDSNGKYVGSLAKDWKTSDDGLTWTFNLRDNIKWHDGTPFTAEDMVWAINAVMKDPEGWSTSANYAAGFKEVQALDPKTVQITLDEPIGNMEYRLSFLYAVARKDFEQFKTPEDLQNFGNDNLLGTGPFKLNTFEKDKGILILDANPDYYGGRPKIDQVIFQTFDNEDAMVQALKVGDVDMMTSVPSAAFKTVQGFDNVKALQLSGRSLTELIINSVPETNDPKPKRNPALTDPKVREAIATAINKQDLVDIVLQSLGQPGTTIVPPSLGGGYWFNSNVKNPDFSLEKANQILEEAGYKKGADGIRAKGNTKLELRLQFPNNRPNYPRIADLISGWLKDIGIKATPEAADPDALTAAVTPTGDYDLVIWGWGADPDPDFILSVLTSDQFVAGGWSDSGYSNPKYDELYKQQQQTVDLAARQKIIKDMQQIAFEDRPYIVLYYDDYLQAYRTDRFRNFIESPLGIDVAESLLQAEPVQ